MGKGGRVRGKGHKYSFYPVKNAYRYVLVLLDLVFVNSQGFPREIHNGETQVRQSEHQ